MRTENIHSWWRGSADKGRTVRNVRRVQGISIYLMKRYSRLLYCPVEKKSEARPQKALHDELRDMGHCSKAGIEDRDVLWSKAQESQSRKSSVGGSSPSKLGQGDQVQKITFK